MNTQLLSFINYCRANPTLRFWQALRNWSGYSFIYGTDKILPEQENINIEDTYYL